MPVSELCGSLPLAGVFRAANDLAAAGLVED